MIQLKMGYSLNREFTNDCKYDEMSGEKWKREV